MKEKAIIEMSNPKIECLWRENENEKRVIERESITEKQTETCLRQRFRSKKNSFF
jgi:hypothetical protein